MFESFQGYQVCFNCQKVTSNPKFCSRSCSAIFNNTHVPKRKRKLLFCKECGQPRFVPRKSLLCEECIAIKVARKNQSLEQIKFNKKLIDSPSYNVYNTIRWHARKLILNWGWKTCAKCGYAKHVEACHIRAVSTFPDEATIQEINDKSNLVALCPNCHWELDHGLLTL